MPVFERRLRAGTRGDNATDWETVVVVFESGTRVAVDAQVGYLGPRELFVRDRDGGVVERALPQRAFATADLRGYYAQATEPLSTYQDTSGRYWLQDTWSNTVRAGAAIYKGMDNTWGDSGLYNGGGSVTTNGETAAADAFISLWSISKMTQMVYGQTVKPTTAVVHYPMNDASSTIASDGSWQIFLGYSDMSAAVKKPLTDIEVVGHEVGHNMISDKTGMHSWFALGEQGGLIEASADIFGMNAGFYMEKALHPLCRELKSGAILCTWARDLTITTDWMFGNRSNHPPALRDFIDPTVKAWSSSIASVDGHVAGGVLRRVYYFLSVGILPLGSAPASAAYDTPQRDTTYLPQGLTGLGLAVANRLWWHTLDGLYFPTATNYASYREVMLQAATTLYGEHSPQYKAVEDAWAAVNVGQPADRTPPQLELTSGMKLKDASYIEATASDANGVAKVEFFFSAPGVGDMKPVGVATSAPWRVVVGGWPTTDTYTLTLIATDTRGNRTTRSYYPVTFDDKVPSVSLTDVTPCSPATSEWCGDYRTQRTYHVSATDTSGVSWVALAVDGPVVGQRYTSTYDFVVTYPVGGDHTLRGSAADTLGNGNATPWQTYNIDFTPPTLTRDVAIAQAQSSVTGDSIDQLVEMDYCVTDASGIALRDGKQRIDVFMDGAPRAVEQRSGSPAGCPSFYIRNVPAGTHSFLVRIYDKWGNFAERTRSVSVVAIKPFVYLYGVGVDTAVLGRITVSGFYNSNGNDIASIAYFLCPSASTCYLQKSEPPPAGLAGSIEYDYETTGLTPGATYKAQIKVTGTNGLSTTVESVWFTIPTTTSQPPPPTEVVFNEIEPNDGYIYGPDGSWVHGSYNVVPSNATVVRGSSSWGNSDLFQITEPGNKVLCIAAARLNNSAAYVEADVFFRRSLDGQFVNVPLDLEDSPSDITDASYRCYVGGGWWPAIDGKYYVMARGLWMNPDDYEFRIKYISNMYRPAPASSTPPAAEHYIFMTSTMYAPAGFGGLLGADAECQARGNAGSFTGPKHRTWRALLSATNVDARDRIDWDGSRPLKNTRGATVVSAVGSAANHWPLTRSALVLYDENSAEISTPYVMTGSNVDGTSNGHHCADWTSASAGTLTYGMDWSTTSGDWINYSSAQDCSAGQKRLYCVSQAAPPE